MQTYRLIKTEFTFLLYTLVMEGFGLRYWTAHEPNLSRTADSSPTNFTLFFFVTTSLMFIIGIGQYAIAYAIKNLYPLATETFIDLCSICNISLLMFDESFQGFYIHGRSPYGQSEVSSEEIRKALESEANGVAQMRGIS